MGMNITHSNKDFSGEEEIERLKKRLSVKSVQMKILSKTTEGTFWPGSNSTYSISNLDHIVAASHLEFKKFSGKDVKVTGWVDEETSHKKDLWSAKYSDHAILYFEVQEADS